MRAERLLSLILTLADGRLHPASELAKATGVSERSIYRDMEVLSGMGIPVESLTGRDGGFRVLPGFALDRSLLDEGELAAVAAALGGMGRATGDGGILGAKSKLGALLARSPERRKSWIRIELGGGQRDRERIEILRRAIEERRLVRITYRDAEGSSTERQVEPIAVCYLWQSWYLWGFCRLRADFRLFKLGRIEAAHVLLAGFDPRPEPSEDAWHRESWESTEPVEVVLSVEAEAAGKADEWFGSFEATADGGRLIRTSLPQNEWLTGYILSFGEGIRVLEPESLARIVSERAEKISRLYKT